MRRTVAALLLVAALVVGAHGSASAADKRPSQTQVEVENNGLAGMTPICGYSYAGDAPVGTEVTGTVTLKVDGVIVGTSNAWRGFPSSLGCYETRGPLHPGTYTVTADYPGDATFDPSSATTSLTLVKRNSELEVLADKVQGPWHCPPGGGGPCPSPNVPEGAPITFGGWAKPDTSQHSPYPSTSGGTVTFYDNGSPVATETTGSDGVARWTTSDLALGLHLISVSWDGNEDYNGATLDQVWRVNIQKAADRLAGSDRIATAIAISKNAWPNDAADAVVLTTGNNFADALGGTAFAVENDAPVLLSASGAALDTRTRAEVARVLPTGGSVYVLGGTAALPASVDAALTNDGFEVVRLAGLSRFDTAVAIATERTVPPAAIALADGRSFPDALAAGAAMGHVGGVVLLTDGRTMAPATAAYLADHPGIPVYAIGGAAAAAAPTATPIVGTDRYDTANDVARAFFDDPVYVGVANGRKAPDALAGGAHAAAFGGPLVLTAPTSLVESTSTYLAEIKSSVGRAAIYGGTISLSNTVKSSVVTVINS
jgi:putative cell wall-binding protein